MGFQAGCSFSLFCAFDPPKERAAVIKRSNFLKFSLSKNNNRRPGKPTATLPQGKMNPSLDSASLGLHGKEGWGVWVQSEQKLSGH